MSQGSYEETEILLQHSEFVLASLEQAARLFRDDGEIMKQLNSADGKKVREFAAAYVQAKQAGQSLPELPANLYNIREKIAMQMIMPIRTIDYTVHWCNLSITQLHAITSASREFDLRWNLPMTTSACRLFSAFCRVVLYLHRISAVTFLIQLFSSSTLLETLSLQCNFDDLLTFVTKCHKEPFSFIATKLSFIKNKLSLMVVNLLPFFSTLFADWTIFDWSMLSIYERQPEQTVGDSMPLTDYTLLANISLFQEVLILFTLTFSSFMDENQQFAVLGAAVLSESNVFYLSRNFPVPIDELLNVAPPSNALTTLRKTLLKTIDRKTIESHLHRMKQLNLLAGEVVNYAGLDMTGFMKFIHIIRAIAGFGYYEIDLFFRVKDKKMWTDEHIKTVAKLLSFLDKLAQIFIDEKTQIERFFVFNLATVDADHLSYLLSKFGTDLGTAGADVVATGELILESLEDLDLNKFDQGIRFDFYPLQLTHGRALHRHNIISQQLRTSFLTPLCEHLMTISLHASAAQDAVRFFLDACQLHMLWRHALRFEEFIQHNAAPAGECASFFHLFELFNYDSIVLTMHPNDATTVTNIVENKIRPRLSTKIFTMLSLLLNEKSKLMTFSIHGPIGQSVPSEKLSLSLLDNDFCTKEANIIMNVAQSNNLIESLPRSITVLGKKIEIAPYFISRISSQLLKIVISNVEKNVTSVSDAAQIVWTFFSQARALNIDQFEDSELLFRRVLLKFALSNAFFNSPDLSKQTQAMLGKESADPIANNDMQRLIVKISDSILQFIKGDHEQFPYCSSIGSFIGNPEQSVLHYRSLIRTIGIHGALYIDCKITDVIVNELCSIYNAYQQVLPSLTNDDKQSVFKHETTKDSAASFHRLSVASTVRSMVRRALRMVLDENTPGLRELLLSDNQKFADTPESHLLLEIISEKDDIYFIRERVAAKIKKEKSGVLEFFTYIAILITAMDFSKVSFNSEYDSLSKNLHLVPNGFSLICSLSPFLFNDANYNLISAATKLFFSTIAEIMAENKKLKKLSDNSRKSLYILIDKFNSLPDFEYGRMKHAFQYAQLTLNYPKE